MIVPIIVYGEDSASVILNSSSTASISLSDNNQIEVVASSANTTTVAVGPRISFILTLVQNNQ